MRLALAASPWPVPRSRPFWPGWRFARELPGHGTDAAALQWRFVRGGVFAPRRLATAFGLLSAVSLGVAIGLWLAGVPAVRHLAAAELLLIGGALAVWSRHAGDAETITLAARELSVEHRRGRRTERAAFRAEWVRVEPAHDAQSLLELTGQGRRARVGRYLRPEWRFALAQELRDAVKHECLRPAAQDPQQEPRR